MNQMYDQPPQYENLPARLTMADRVAVLEKQLAEVRDELRQSQEFAQLVGRELGFGS